MERQLIHRAVVHWQAKFIIAAESHSIMNVIMLVMEIYCQSQNRLWAWESHAINSTVLLPHYMTCFWWKAWQMFVNRFFQTVHLSDSAFLFYIYAFSRRFYPKGLTEHSGYTFIVSTCVPWESNPQPFALLTQCSTTEPQEQLFYSVLRLY